MKIRTPKLRKTSRGQLARGQAMVEYSIVSWLLIVGLVLASTVRIIPGEKDKEKTNLIETFLLAYQNYYDSFYFVLNLPFP